MSAQDAIDTYRDAETRLRHDAKAALAAGARSDGLELLAIARHVGMEFVRNYIGSGPDRWEQPVKDDRTARDGLWRP